MMKLKYFALPMAFIMAASLTGCSADRDGVASEQPSSSVSSDYSGRASAGVDDGVRNSAYVGDAPNSAGINDGIQNSANVDNDAAYGGGAGGTNDYNNDGIPDGSVGDAVDDIGEAAGDLSRGLGNAARDQINNSGVMR